MKWLREISFFNQLICLIETLHSSLWSERCLQCLSVSAASIGVGATSGRCKGGGRECPLPRSCFRHVSFSPPKGASSRAVTLLSAVRTPTWLENISVSSDGTKKRRRTQKKTSHLCGWEQVRLHLFWSFCVFSVDFVKLEASIFGKGAKTLTLLKTPLFK